jgi:hypothetical protein
MKNKQLCNPSCVIFAINIPIAKKICKAGTCIVNFSERLITVNHHNKSLMGKT